jgi:hypothetical protein
MSVMMGVAGNRLGLSGGLTRNVTRPVRGARDDRRLTHRRFRDPADGDRTARVVINGHPTSVNS